MGQLIKKGKAILLRVGRLSAALVAGLVLTFPFMATESLLAAPAVTTFPLLPNSYAPKSIASGSDKNLWFTELGENGGKIGRITTGGGITEYSVPTDGDWKPPALEGIISGPDGALWFADPQNNRIGRITTSGSITRYLISNEGQGPSNLAVGPDGAIWFNAGIRIGRITTAGQVTLYNTPSLTFAGDITAGPDGNLWFTGSNSGGSLVGRITTTGAITLYPYTSPSVSANEIVSGPDGNLWFTNVNGSSIGRVTTSGSFTTYPTSTAGSGPTAITNGPDGALWFTESNVNKIARITTAGTITEYPLSFNAAPTGITTGPDGVLWFTAPAANKIGRLVPDPNPCPFAPTSLTAIPQSATQATLNWTYIPGVLNYKIYRNGRLVNQWVPSSAAPSYTDNAPESGLNTYYVSAVNDNCGESALSNKVGIAMDTQHRVTGALTMNGQPLPATIYSNTSVQLVDGSGTARASTAERGVSAYEINAANLSTGSYGIRYQHDGSYAKLDSTTANLPHQFVLKEVGTPIQYNGNDITENLDFTTKRLTVAAKDAQGKPANYQIDVSNVGESTIPNNAAPTTYTLSNVSSASFTGSIGQTSFALFPGLTYKVCAAGPTYFCQNITFNGDMSMVMSPKPAAPLSLTAPSPTRGSVTLSWGSVTNATGYNVYRDNTKINTTSSTNFTDNNAPEGNYTYYVTALNSSTESSPSNSVSVVVDRTTPSITHTITPTPNTDGWNTTDVTVTFTCNDDRSGIESCSSPVRVPNEDGIHTVTGTAVDKAGNTKTVEATVKIDTIKPTITFTAASNGWINTDGGVPYECTNDDGSKTQHTAPIVVGSDGQTTAIGSCTDQAGNTATQIIPVQVDTAEPAVDYHLSQPTNTLGWSTGPVTVTFECNDPTGTSGSASGVEFCSDEVTVTAEGTTVVTGIARDKAGNINEINVFVNIDSVKPTLNYTVTPAEPVTNGWYTSDVTINFTCTDATSGVATCPQPITVTQDGVRNITATAKDVAGNTQTVDIPIKLDKAAPTIGFSLSQTPNDQGWNNGPVTVTFNCDDATSGIDTCTDPVPVSTEGGTIVTGTAVDNAGHISEVNVFVFIDYHAPTTTSNISPIPNSNGWNNTDVTVSFGCADTFNLFQSGIRTCLNSFDPTSANPSLATVTAEGIHQITGTATDNADNTGDAPVTVKLDKTAPALAMPTWATNPKPTSASTTLTIPVTDNLAGIEEAEYFIGNTDPGQGNGATMTLTNQQSNSDGAVTSANLTTTYGTDFQPGVYKISVRAKDMAGNWSLVSSDYLVVYDPNGPQDVAGSKQIIPVNGSDYLPGMPDSKNSKAKLGFDVYYTATGTVDQNSQLTLDYETGQSCKSSQPVNCHTANFTVNATNPNVINWLTITGSNSENAGFIGQGTLTIDGTVTHNPFRLAAVDGGRLNPTSNDDTVLYIFPVGVNPADAPASLALYHLHINSIGNWVVIK